MRIAAAILLLLTSFATLWAETATVKPTAEQLEQKIDESLAGTTTSPTLPPISDLLNKMNAEDASSASANASRRNPLLREGNANPSPTLIPIYEAVREVHGELDEYISNEGKYNPAANAWSHCQRNSAVYFRLFGSEHGEKHFKKCMAEFVKNYNGCARNARNNERACGFDYLPGNRRCRLRHCNINPGGYGVEPLSLEDLMRPISIPSFDDNQQQPGLDLSQLGINDPESNAFKDRLWGDVDQRGQTDQRPMTVANNDATAVDSSNDGLAEQPQQPISSERGNTYADATNPKEKGTPKQTGQGAQSNQEYSTSNNDATTPYYGGFYAAFTSSSGHHSQRSFGTSSSATSTSTSHQAVHNTHPQDIPQQQPSLEKTSPNGNQPLSPPSMEYLYQLSRAIHNFIVAQGLLGVDSRELVGLVQNLADTYELLNNQQGHLPLLDLAMLFGQIGELNQLRSREHSASSEDRAKLAAVTTELAFLGFQWGDLSDPQTTASDGQPTFTLSIGELQGEGGHTIYMGIFNPQFGSPDSAEVTGSFAAFPSPTPAHIEQLANDELVVTFHAETGEPVLLRGQKQSMAKVFQTKSGEFFVNNGMIDAEVMADIQQTIDAQHAFCYGAYFEAPKKIIKDTWQTVKMVGRGIDAVISPTNILAMGLLLQHYAGESKDWIVQQYDDLTADPQGYGQDVMQRISHTLASAFSWADQKHEAVASWAEDQYDHISDDPADYMKSALGTVAELTESQVDAFIAKEQARYDHQLATLVRDNPDINPQVLEIHLRKALIEHYSENAGIVFGEVAVVVLPLPKGLRSLKGVKRGRQVPKMAAKRLGTLSKAGDNIWDSAAGLRYAGADRNGLNRVQHVLRHAEVDSTRVPHSVFNVGRNKVLGLVDEAWRMRGNSLPNDPGAFVVPMGRTVGTAGENAVKIIVRPRTNEIITAYPVVVP